MAKDDQQEGFERALTSTLARVIDFLKFAEAKNAALLTFSSAWIIGSVNALTRVPGLPPDWQTAFTVALPLFAASALVAMASFLPKTLLSRFHRDPEQAKSLLYFGDIATFAPGAYKERVRDRYYPPEAESATRNYLDDLSIQIAVNSQITVRKLRFFYVGALIVIVAIIVLFVPAARAAQELISGYQGP